MGWVIILATLTILTLAWFVRKNLIFHPICRQSPFEVSNWLRFYRLVTAISYAVKNMIKYQQQKNGAQYCLFWLILLKSDGQSSIFHPIWRRSPFEVSNWLRFYRLVTAISYAVKNMIKYPKKQNGAQYCLFWLILRQSDAQSSIFHPTWRLSPFEVSNWLRFYRLVTAIS